MVGLSWIRLTPDLRQWSSLSHLLSPGLHCFGWPGRAMGTSLTVAEAHLCRAVERWLGDRRGPCGFGL